MYIIRPLGYLVGDSLTLADISVASPFVNATHAAYVHNAAAYHKLTAYLAAIHTAQVLATGSDPSARYWDWGNRWAQLIQN